MVMCSLLRPLYLIGLGVGDLGAHRLLWNALGLRLGTVRAGSGGDFEHACPHTSK